MKYGRETEVILLDDEGSTVSTEARIHEGVVKANPLKMFEVKVRVSNEQDVFTEFLKFSKALADNERLYTSEDTNKYDPSFRIEKNKKTTTYGFYYVWKTWTERI